jgi:predicted ATPase
MYLDAIQPRFESASAERYPFDLPLWHGLESLAFETPVTFFVGDNGTGKSTLLEAIAVQFRLPALTQTSVERHPLMQGARDLAGGLRFVRRPQGRGTRRHGFFFRADDVTGFVQGLSRAVEEHESLEQHFEVHSTLPSHPATATTRLRTRTANCS